jgi:dCTP deaminase
MTSKNSVVVSGEGLIIWANADQCPKEHGKEPGLPTALSDSEIRNALNGGNLVIDPFDEASLNPAGYDLRLSVEAGLEPSEHRLVATMERVELGSDLVGVLHLRSSLAREGILASLALVDPGFRGQLTISLFNSGKKPIRIKAGERFVQLTLFRLGRQAGSKYDGRYQDSRGIVGSRR